ncbi:HNH endonuclease [Streptomyces sp. MB22_4]|uniref:HNH endonuclease n=1 Tax=Streptomyces sp. MB22_4 TaxID=3383120 RepID=UPI0039A0A47F
MSRAPTPVPIAKPRKSRATPPSAWPIALTPAAPVNDTQTPVAAKAPRSVEKPVPSISAAGATPKDAAKSPPARKQRLCPVCNKPASAGRVRHQQCEERAVPGQGAKHVAPPTISPAITPEASSEYKRLVRQVERSETATHGKRRETSRRDPIRLSEARIAVLLRCQGHCENPACGGEPNDLTDDGRPILEVDHVKRIAEGGRDHPVQMVALCPNCHAMKERGANRLALQAILRDIAARSHERWNSAPS